VELSYNCDAQRVGSEGFLDEPCVLVDVGVQRGEHERWHQLGDHLIVHGIDPIQEAVDELSRDAIAVVRHRENYALAVTPLSVQQLIKLAVIYELHELNDIAVDND
jgi:hypothetical protein